jgi:DNA-binding MarR family transcriptional regulator
MTDSAPAAQLQHQALSLWRFQRFFSRRRDVLPAEDRLLWEVALAPHGIGHGQLCERLAIDSPNLGRLARSLGAKGLLRASRASHDARMIQYEATRQGHRAWRWIERAGIDSAKSQLSRIDPLHRRRLVDAMRSIETILEGRAPEPWSEVVIRPTRPGDLGWAIGRMGELHPEQEATLARTLPGCAGWIAETCGERSGCVFVELEGAAVAVRLLFVDPAAYGVRIRELLLEQAAGHARCTGATLAR